jgi:hypothetical protein
MPTPVQAAALKHTLRTVNEAACWVSGVAFERGVPREYELRKHTYAKLRERGLGAQVAQQVIKKVRDAYTSLHANLRAGNLGKKGSKRRVKAESKPISLKHCSPAGAAASLRTRTGTLPASWPEEARTRGMRGGSHTSRPPAHKS